VAGAILNNCDLISTACCVTERVATAADATMPACRISQEHSCWRVSVHLHLYLHLLYLFHVLQHQRATCQHFQQNRVAAAAAAVVQSAPALHHMLLPLHSGAPHAAVADLLTCCWLARACTLDAKPKVLTCSLAGQPGCLLHQMKVLPHTSTTSSWAILLRQLLTCCLLARVCT
jgi:hypothetical protein